MVPIRWKVLPIGEAQTLLSRQIKTEEGLEVEVKVEEEWEEAQAQAQEIEAKVKEEQAEVEAQAQAQAQVQAQIQEIEVKEEEARVKEEEDLEIMVIGVKEEEEDHEEVYRVRSIAPPRTKMPRKKNYRIVNPNAPPGIARTHLEMNFPVMPESKSDLKNGHILYMYTSFGKSLAETQKWLTSHYSLPDAEGYSIGAVMLKVKSLITRTLLKFKKLSSPKELGAFTEICNETFKFPEGSQRISLHDIPPPVAQDPESLTPAEIQVPIFPDTRCTRELLSLTPREQKMKKRLNFLSTSIVALTLKYRTKISELRAQLKTPKRVVNQALKRKQNQIDTKDRKIQELKAKLRGNTLARELAETKAEFLKLQKAHSQLLKFRGSEKKGETVSIHQYRKVQEKLKDREDEVRRLKLDNLVLKEAIETLEAACIAKSNEDQKTYSSTTRMHAFDGAS
ncbi:uncharacterized protein LOC129715829 [Leucoraja erinacea]|uniref:uncharacterized protein LOC129715829 n=1 Tax=Leucoraja erinaceus TaxID=7782 RepID=UPI002458F582|nr:uncharacterized protein LOC129715829 [Leucoraja erinacea]